MKLYIALMVLNGLLLLAGCALPLKPAAMNPVEGENYPALYITLRPDEALVPAVTIDTYNLTVVSPHADIEQLLEKANVIYLHPEVVGLVDQEVIRGAYESGAAVVAINTFISTLAELLGVAASFDDLRPLRAGVEGITIAMFYHNYDPVTQQINGGGAHAEYYEKFDDFPQAVNTLLRLNRNPIRR